MRLVFVHGRAQGSRSEQQLRDEWIPALERGIDALGGEGLPRDLDIRMPFYGAELDRLIDQPSPGGMIVARGGTADVPDQVQAELLLEMCLHAGVTDAQIAADLGQAYVARGPLNLAWVQAAGRLLAKRFPWLSEVVLAQWLRDVDGYLTRPDVAQVVDDIVRRDVQPDTDAENVVVVSHSLGSVVAYNVLTDMAAGVRVPLFMTLGSPLGIPVVKRYVRRPLGMPSGVKKWVNGTDERDPVALYARLDRPTFPADIENASDIRNPHDEPHGISGYLSDGIVAKRILHAVLARS